MFVYVWGDDEIHDNDNGALFICCLYAVAGVFALFSSDGYQVQNFHFAIISSLHWSSYNDTVHVGVFLVT